MTVATEHLPRLGVADAVLEHGAGLARGAIEVVGPWGSAKTLIAVQAAQEENRPVLFVAPGRIEAEGIYDDLTTFAEPAQCAMFPAWEVLPNESMDPADDIVAERMNTLLRISEAVQQQVPMYVVAPVRSLLQGIVQEALLKEGTLGLAVGSEYDLDEVLHKLVELGYEREMMVEQRGQMSLRGGIFDIFPISSELPYRLEFFGDEVESIRRFEPETQRSVEDVTSIQVTPRSEKVLLTRQANDDVWAYLTDYFPDDTLVVIDEPMAVAETAGNLAEQFSENPAFKTWDGVRERLAQFLNLSMAQVAFDSPHDDVPRVTAPIRSATSWDTQADDFWEQLELWDRDGFTVQIYCHNTGERQRLMELLAERGHRFDGETSVRVAIGRMRAGFCATDDKLAVLTERDIFGRHYTRRTRRRFEAGTAITAFSDLKVGNYIVHEHHGIGRYMGLKKFEGKSGEFLSVSYSGGDILYVPATHIDQVQKYVGGDGATPSVDKIGGKTWARKKARVKKAVRDMTDQLVKLYAAREHNDGHPYSADTHWQDEFEGSFQYDETPDQAHAIVDMKRDMESARPMDRLVCGDVGFGKTEVAMRGAFKAVMDGKQVAVLVPTTVLAEQHFETFTERFADYPVRVEMLSRFRSTKQVRETVERLKTGECDVVIGTHRLASKDVAFKDLGLVIIDEEQRFGVAHKERLKELRTSVDVLTMTATPIPRTLNMAFLGARDMSVINTAPNDRLPVHTCIETFREDLIQEAIQRELARQGQVFFLHNRVHNIIPYVNMVQRLVPKARCAIAHGQMKEHELEHVMANFVRGEIDVLVCTTIIGSGIDIPNANTIIVNNADMFGLGELYQLRGRVGRYKHRAFAYLLIPGDRALSEDAQKRLKALEEFSTLGAGFRIAMRDLEIRGCGNLLGAEQSGNIQTVGFDAYTQLISEAVAELKGTPTEKRSLPPFDIVYDAGIPDEYVPSTGQKITLYKRIAGVMSVDELDELRDELKDRFGQPPAPVRRLLDVMRIRAQAADVGVTNLTANKHKLTVEMASANLLTKATQAELQQHFGKNIQLAFRDAPALELALKDVDAIKAAADMLGVLEEG
jgi:transcription-repair coupling factor (superfamily II helicase)